MTHPLHQTLDHLETCTPDQQWDTLAELQRHGRANLAEPRGKRDNWDPQVFSITCHGITASGTDRAETLRNWIKVASAEAEALAPRDPGLTAALDIVEGGKRAPFHETVAACNLVFANAASVGVASAARARGVLIALANARRCKIEDLPRQPPGDTFTTYQVGTAA